MNQSLAALVAAGLLAGLHVGGARVRLRGVPRSRWLSAFGGIAVAYVFVHLLPELAEGQAAIEGQRGGDGPLLDFLEHHVYLMALLGLAVFYGVEQHSLRARRQSASRGEPDGTDSTAFWLSIGSFAAYNVIVGSLLLRDELEQGTALALYAFALGVHFVANDFALREHHRHRYDQVGRWLVAAAVLAGWALGATTEVPERVTALVLAFIGGGVILNAVKEELPTERQAQFRPFAASALLYTALLQVA